MALEVTKQFDENKKIWVLKPVGEIDIYTAPNFKKDLLNIIEQNDTDVLIDGEHLEYIDSTGLGVLISGLKKLKEKGNDIRIISIKPNISKLFEITGLNNVFKIEG